MAGDFYDLFLIYSLSRLCNQCALLKDIKDIQSNHLPSFPDNFWNPGYLVFSIMSVMMMEFSWRSATLSLTVTNKHFGFVFAMMRLEFSWASVTPPPTVRVSNWERNLVWEDENKNRVDNCNRSTSSWTGLIKISLGWLWNIQSHKNEASCDRFNYSTSRQTDRSIDESTASNSENQ